ncbi:DUF4158 domain-containing protein [Pseudoalteromonas caenipelagi]|uniref:DUF4158 domain-containing protein n=1 Tax=Pseudoalteromonas caenipelagi TaxID=2726988 RepID=UPI003F6DF7F4
MKQFWDAHELSEHWSLTFDELELLKTKPARSRLAFCLQLKYYQYTGTFPKSLTDLPDSPLHHLVDQLGTEIKDIKEYDWNGRTGRRHREEILVFLGVAKLTEETRHELVLWLCNSVYANGLKRKSIHTNGLKTENRVPG